MYKALLTTIPVKVKPTPSCPNLFQNIAIFNKIPEIKIKNHLNKKIDKIYYDATLTNLTKSVVKQL